MSDFSFYLVTDPHYFDESFGRSGSAYEARSRTDQKCVAETPAILDAGFAQIAADRETRVILIPGDLCTEANTKAMWAFASGCTDCKKRAKRFT